MIESKIIPADKVCTFSKDKMHISSIGDRQIIVWCTSESKTEDDFFEGVVIYTEVKAISIFQHSGLWLKVYYRPYYGEVTITCSTIKC